MPLITVEGDGSDKNDRLYGWDSIDSARWLGNDYMSGENGNDKPYGDEGRRQPFMAVMVNDHLDGGEGN